MISRGCHRRALLSTLALTALLLFVGAGPGRADWAPGGMRPLNLYGQVQGYLTADGHGGLFISMDDWSDYNGPTYENTRVQHVDSRGAVVAGWPDIGDLASPPGLIDDSPYPGASALNVDGSVTVCAKGSTSYWVARFSGEGQMAGQGLFGPIATNGLGVLAAPTLDNGDLIVSDNYSATPGQIFVQRLGSDCQPSTGWTSDRRLLLEEPTGYVELTHAMPDPKGGAWLAYYVVTPNGHSSEGDSLFIVRHVVQKLRDDGALDSTWATSTAGSAEFAVRPAMGFAHEVVADGAGGLYCVWMDARKGNGLTGLPYQQAFDIYATRIGPDGQMAAGWPASGLPVCTAPDLQEYPVVAADGSGGVYVAWGYSGGEGPGIHAQHLLGNGTVAPGWPVDGKRLFAPQGGYQSSPLIACDTLGGAFIAAAIYPGDAPAKRVFVQHVAFDGSFDAPWSAAGYMVDTTSTGQDTPALTVTARGTAAVGWVRSASRDYRLQQVMIGGIVPTRLALATTDARSDRVRLTWTASGDHIASLGVERRTPGGVWKSLAEVLPDGQDMFGYEDHAVSPGEAYDYRASWSAKGVPQHSAETRIVVPVLAHFALAGARPNPASRSGVVVMFSLESSHSATLEMFDLSGRRVLERSVGTLGPGDHALRLGSGLRLGAGLYWLRLAQGAHRASVRMVLTE